MNNWNFRLDEINLHSLIRDILRDFWIPILLALSLWFAVGSYGRLTYTPSYRSEATFVISAKGSSSAYNSLSLTTNMAQVFSEVFESNMLRSKVEESLEMENQDWYISTRIISQTNFMVVSVISSSPEQAFLALNAVIEQYPNLAQQMFGNAILEVITDPKVPTSPYNSMDISSMKKKGAMLGFAGGVGILMLFTVFRDTVQTSAAAKRKLDGRYLRSVRHEEKNKTLRSKRKRKNIAPLICHPFVSAGFREDYQSLCSKMEYHMNKRRQKVILVSSGGENEGKSTVAANLALGLGQKGYRVALLDCDFRKPALHKIFSVTAEPERDFGKFISQQEQDGDVLHYLSRYGIYLAVNATRHKYPQRLLSSRKMAGYLHKLRREMDYVILDTPPMLVAADAEALSALCDVALLVVREDWILAKNVNDCLDSLRQNAPDVAGFVLNNCHEFGFRGTA